MKKIVKIGFPIVCVAIIIFTFWLMADMKEKVAENNDKKNEISEDIDNSLEQNDENVLNQNSENKVGEEALLNSKDDIYLRKVIQVLENEIKVKDNQYFTSEGEEDGRYIVALRDAETTEAEIYYIVDVDTGEYEIYY